MRGNEVQRPSPQAPNVQRPRCIQHRGLTTGSQRAGREPGVQGLEAKKGTYSRKGLWIKCHREVKKDKDMDLPPGFGNMGLLTTLTNAFSAVMGKSVIINTKLFPCDPCASVCL